MDIRTLLFVNLIFLFLYAAIIFINSSVSGRVRGSMWFVLSNVSRGVAWLLLSLSAFLPKVFCTIAGDVLMAVGLVLLHRSVAEVLGRGKTAWNLQVGLAVTVFFGVTYLSLVNGNHSAAMMLVSVALAVQMALTTALLLSHRGRELNRAIWFTGGILFLYALVEMMRAIAMFRSDGSSAQPSPAMTALLLLGILLSNGGAAFGFMSLSAAQLRRELMWLAEHDALTGLLNRRGLKSLADRTLTASHRAGEPLSTVMLDLDGMKAANDSAGHECGDAMLCAVARLLTKTVGSRGAVARLGGDEFVVILPGLAEGGAVEIAESLRYSLEQLQVRGCSPRASFGVASMDGLCWEQAMRLSDEALYRAKNAGRNRVMCYA